MREQNMESLVQSSTGQWFKVTPAGLELCDVADAIPSDPHKESARAAAEREIAAFAHGREFHCAEGIRASSDFHCAEGIRVTSDFHCADGIRASSDFDRAQIIEP